MVVLLVVLLVELLVVLLALVSGPCVWPLCLALGLAHGPQWVYGEKIPTKVFWEPSFLTAVWQLDGLWWVFEVRIPWVLAHRIPTTTKSRRQRHPLKGETWWVFRRGSQGRPWDP